MGIYYMKAVKILKPGVVNLVEIDKPKVGADEILIKLKALGLCGSDLKTYWGQNKMVSYPRIPGHEIAGEIIQTGKNVPSEFQIGQLVTVSPYSSCGKCLACQQGRVNCCPYNQTLGIQRDGAAVEFIVLPYKKVFIVGNLPEEQIACIEPLSVGWHATNRAQVSSKDIVLVFGCGMIGLGAIAASGYKGAKVIAVDINDLKLEKAKALGANYTINSQKEDLEKKIFHLTSGQGVNVVIEAVGLSETFKKAIDLVCFAGRVVYIGYAKEPVEYDASLFVKKEIDIKGSRNALDDEIKEVIKMVESRKIKIENLITQNYLLKNLGEAFRVWDKNTDKVTKIIIHFS
ncbi:MAG: zinc-binding alcohol dehydrogenase family protein [Candidatus Atribacteria bacterium]|nr:zinc-binding alcohol dehydrogenase family protein [Candidatus Atribacteria bacterium]